MFDTLRWLPLTDEQLTSTGAGLGADVYTADPQRPFSVHVGEFRKAISAFRLGMNSKLLQANFRHVGQLSTYREPSPRMSLRMEGLPVVVSRVELSRTKPSQAKISQDKPNRAMPSQVKSRRVGLIETSRAESQHSCFHERFDAMQL